MLLLSTAITSIIFCLSICCTLSVNTTPFSFYSIFIRFLLLLNVWTFNFTITAYNLLLLFFSSFSVTVSCFSIRSLNGDDEYTKIILICTYTMMVSLILLKSDIYSGFMKYSATIKCVGIYCICILSLSTLSFTKKFLI